MSIPKQPALRSPHTGSRSGCGSPDSQSDMSSSGSTSAKLSVQLSGSPSGGSDYSSDQSSAAGRRSCIAHLPFAAGSGIQRSAGATLGKQELHTDTRTSATSLPAVKSEGSTGGHAEGQQVLSAVTSSLGAAQLTPLAASPEEVRNSPCGYVLIEQ